jgi:hypothetical protein
LWSPTENDSHRRRIGCGTLASDAMGVKPAVQAGPAQTTTRAHMASSRRGPGSRRRKPTGQEPQHRRLPLLARGPSRIRTQCNPRPFCDSCGISPRAKRGRSRGKDRHMSHIYWQRVGCQIFSPYHATRAYSWINSPSRSRRMTLPADARTAGPSGSRGGACPNARCGRYRL